MNDVAVDERGVTYTDGAGRSSRLAWADLRGVEIVTTEDGPFQEDVFWVLRGPATTLSIPQSLPGIADLVVRLQQLPGFNNMALIEAMSCSGRGEFRCWEHTNP